jgi:uncharacterized protein (DUF1330 family)
MAKGYWIVRVDIKDEEPVKRYAAGNHSIFKKFGGRYLVRSQKFEVPEGSSRSRQVVVEFPDYASALACYHSPEYQAAILSSWRATMARSGRAAGSNEGAAGGCGCFIKKRSNQYRLKGVLPITVLGGKGITSEYPAVLIQG